MPKRYAVDEFNRRWFISHRGVDTDLAKWVDAQFQELGQQTVLDAYDFLSGQSFLTRMEESFQSTDHTICLLTENFFSSPYCLQEFGDAFDDDPNDTKKRLVIVMAGNMKDGDLPDCVKDRIYIDLRHKTVQEQKEEFDTKITAILRKTQRPNPDLQHKVLVMFAQFRELGKNVSSNPGVRWPVMFQYKLQDLMREEDAAIIEISDEIEDENHAQRLMKSSGAQIVIWGEVDEDLLGMRYSFNDSLPLSGFEPRLLQSSQTTDLTRGLIPHNMLEMYLKNGGDTEYHIHLLLGILNYEKSQYNDAISNLSHCLELFPLKSLPDSVANNYLANLIEYIGIAKHDSGDYHGAISNFNEAMDLNPEDCSISILRRGFSRYEIRDLHGSISDLKEGLKFHPDSPAIHFYLGKAKSGLGDFHGALADFNRAIGFGVEFDNLFIDRGAARSSTGDYHGAIADYNKAIELDISEFGGEKRFIIFLRGIAKVELGDYIGAMSDFNEALEYGDHDQLFFCRGGLKHKLGDYHGSILDYTKAIELSLEDPIVYKLRSDVYRLLGDKNRAKNDNSTYRRLIKKAKRKNKS